jgi:hypothetical protein
MEACGLEMTADVHHDRRRLSRKRNCRMAHVPIDVVDSEADPFEMKRRDRAREGLGFLEERRKLSRMRRVGAQESEEVGKTVLRRLTAVDGHVG